MTTFALYMPGTNADLETSAYNAARALCATAMMQGAFALASVQVLPLSDTGMLMSWQVPPPPPQASLDLVPQHMHFLPLMFLPWRGARAGQGQ